MMKKALFVGINNYPNAPLKGCVNDATELANLLEVNGDGSPNFSSILLRDTDKPITKSSLMGEIKKLFSDDCDAALFYFSGHGFYDETGGYIVTLDSEQHDEGISMEKILLLANDSKIKNRIIILDCCFSGSFGSPEMIGGDKAFIKEGTTILTASRNYQAAEEKDGNGIFTKLLIDALRGGASDLMGRLTPGSIYAFVDQALGPWGQRPVFKTNISNFFVLRETTPAIDMATLRRIPQHFPAAEDEYELDPTYEHEDGRMIPEHSRIFKDLQMYERVGLVVPVGEVHMYHAAMNSKSCKLTAMGARYWNLVRDKMI